MASAPVRVPVGWHAGAEVGLGNGVLNSLSLGLEPGSQQGPSPRSHREHTGLWPSHLERGSLGGPTVSGQRRAAQSHCDLCVCTNVHLVSYVLFGGPSKATVPTWASCSLASSFVLQVARTPGSSLPVQPGRGHASRREIFLWLHQAPLQRGNASPVFRASAVSAVPQTPRLKTAPERKGMFRTEDAGLLLCPE